MPVPLLDLRAQHATIRDEVVAAMMGVVDSQLFILGAPVEQLERDVAELSHTKYAVGCANGTDALLLALRALDIGRGRRGRSRRRSRSSRPPGRSTTSARRRCSWTSIRRPSTSALMPPPPFSPRRFVTHEISGGDGHGYIMVAEVPPRPWLPLLRQKPPGTGIVILSIAVLVSGIVCYFLAGYLTSDVRRLRAAAQQLAAGDLNARADAPKRRRRDEIAYLVRDFNSMAARLQDLVTAQSRLLNDISHELRSPLARLSVALGLAWQRSGPGADTALERIELEANRLNELIGRLLTLARLEGGDDAMRQMPIPMEDLVQEIALDADFEAQIRPCRVRSVIQEDVTVPGNESLLHSAIENVVRNAMRHTAEGTEVEIRLARELRAGKDEAVIRVLDCGPGVPKESLEKLFRPFYRLDDARERQTGGVGLGLAITERAVRLHGGTVRQKIDPRAG